MCKVEICDMCGGFREGKFYPDELISSFCVSGRFICNDCIEAKKILWKEENEIAKKKRIKKQESWIIKIDKILSREIK